MAFVVNVGIPILQAKLFLNSTLGLQNPKHWKETLKKGPVSISVFPWLTNLVCLLNKQKVYTKN